MKKEYYEIDISPIENSLYSAKDVDLIKLLEQKQSNSMKTLSRNCFSLKEFRIYLAENYDSGIYPSVKYKSLPNKPLTKRINIVGGNIKITFETNVNLIVCENQTMHKFVRNFCGWRDAVLDNKLDEFKRRNQDQTIFKTEFKDKAPKNKREEQLLGVKFFKVQNSKVKKIPVD